MQPASRPSTGTVSRRPVRGVAVCLALALSGGVALAQGALDGSGRRSQATRTELESAAAAAERVARSTHDGKLRERKADEAQRIRERLREGDFQPGHRIYLVVSTDSALTDTFTVRSDRKLLLPNLPEISLAGVLDSELESYLTTQVSKYVRNPTVRATGLLRIAITGAVGRPGFYSVPTDALLSDVVMLAGGPTGVAELRKSVVRRGSNVVLRSGAVDEAFRSGLTVSDVAMRPGDEVEVPDKTQRGWAKIAASVGAVSGLVFGIVWIVRSF
jgi:SLBB domain-containing protein/polysaccharide biosynthesis/export protein